MRRLLLTLACTMAAWGCICNTARAQKPTTAERRAKIDSMLSQRYYRTPYDTNYVVRPEGKLTLKLRMNQTGNEIYSKGTINDVHAKANVSTSNKTTFSVSANYRGLGIALAVNPSKWKGIYKDYELNINFYSSRLSLDMSYQRSESLTGDMETGALTEQLQTGDAVMKVLNMAGYYTFNHRRFSFPAAFTQSYIQRRSAGSWLAGFSYQGGSIKTSDDLLQKRPDAYDVRVYTGHFGIGGGYGYSWVIARRWLLHFSILPTFVVYNRNNMSINGERLDAPHVRLNMIFNERAAIVYQFSSRWFAGANIVANNSVFKDEVVVVSQNKWRARAFVGVRLGN